MQIWTSFPIVQAFWGCTRPHVMKALYTADAVLEVSAWKHRVTDPLPFLACLGQQEAPFPASWLPFPPLL
jgi:hypothetical protein